jgi:tetratricopeptide (TPR) repeat protein
MLKRDHHGAVAEFARALEINPSCTVGYGGLAAVLAWGGRSEEAIANNQIACRCDPRNPAIFFGFFVTALAHFTALRYQEAAVWATQALQRKRLYKSPHLLRVAALAHAGEVERAQNLATGVRARFPDVDRAFVDNLPFIRSIDRENFVRGLELAGVLD